MRASCTCNFPRPDCFSSFWPQRYAGAKTGPEDFISLVRGLVLTVVSSGYSPSCALPYDSSGNQLPSRTNLLMLRQVQRFVLRVGYRLLRMSWRLRHPVTLGVRLLLVENGKILLVKHTYRPGVLAWRATGPRGVPCPDGPPRSPGGGGRDDRRHRTVGNSLPSPVLAK